MNSKPLLIIILFATSLLASEKNLVCNYGRYNPEPYIIVDKTRPDKKIVSKGIIKEICEALANELKVKVELREVPRKRATTFCLDGKTDIIITARPEWLPELAHIGHWMPVVYSINQHLYINPNGGKDLTSINDLKGKSIGMTFGHKYTNEELNDLVDKDEIKRVDNHSTVQSLKQLKYNRVNAVLTEEIIFNYQKLVRPGFRSLKKASVNLNLSQKVTPVLCPKSKFDPRKVYKIFQKLKRKKVFRSILGRYR